MTLGEVLDRLCLASGVAFWLMHCWDARAIARVLAMLLSQDGLRESVDNCKALTGGGGALATGAISPLKSGVASAPPGLQRASRHGISVRSSLTVCCWPWIPELVLWLVLALKGCVLIA